EGWFAHLALICPHPPFLAPPPWHALYPSDGGPPAVRAASRQAEAAVHPLLAALHATIPLDRFIPRAAGLAADLSPPDLARLRATYWGMIAMVDAEIGRLLDWLRRTGRDSDTLIVFTSDHGELL